MTWHQTTFFGGLNVYCGEWVPDCYSIYWANGFWKVCVESSYQSITRESSSLRHNRTFVGTREVKILIQSILGSGKRCNWISSQVAEPLRTADMFGDLQYLGPCMGHVNL